MTEADLPESTWTALRRAAVSKGGPDFILEEVDCIGIGFDGDAWWKCIGQRLVWKESGGEGLFADEVTRTAMHVDDWFYVRLPATTAVILE